MSEGKGASLQLETAERQLERVQRFFPRIDSKVSALFAIASAQIALAALNLSVNDFKVWYIAIPAVVFLLIISVTIINLYRCTYPHVEGGAGSLIYFAEIAKRRESQYIDEFIGASRAELLRDVAGQIWRNSEIVTCKYKYLKQATIALMLSLIPWTILLAAASLTHGGTLKVTG